MKHTFYIPVMGTGFTADTPIQVAPYGVDSVIPLLDDVLLEHLRKYYSEKYNLFYEKIADGFEARSKRITAYLNMVDDIINMQVKQAMSQKNVDFFKKYRDMLPSNSPFIKSINNLINDIKDNFAKEMSKLTETGKIDVNIMTKIDADAHSKGEKLAEEFSIALASLRGYAESKIRSGVIFSAGLNRRLFSYMEQFSVFFHSAEGLVDKRIILKVSDYRSALLQAKFLSKKGLWVSEFRIESGLNCGGHTFPTDGQLLGPILEEFKEKKQELKEMLFASVNEARTKKGMPLLLKTPDLHITVQGGVGTHEEQNILLEHYEVDRVGWGSPFLLVPEATGVDQVTLNTLLQEGDKIYSSHASPLGVRFQNMLSSLSEKARLKNIQDGSPGSACPKRFLVSNTEFSKTPVCTASKFYQKNKIAQILGLESTSADEKQSMVDDVVKKSCICNDLSSGILIKYGIADKNATQPAVCPGPNIKFFDKVSTLVEMVQHIYGGFSILSKKVKRPHMFLNELDLYINYWSEGKTDNQEDFKTKLLSSIDYYQEKFKTVFKKYGETTEDFLGTLEKLKSRLK